MMDNTAKEKIPGRVTMDDIREKNTSVGNVYCEGQTFASKEAFKKLRTNISLTLSDDKTCKVIGVTSSQPSEGKSTVSINLAYSYAELGKKVVLIDCDMRRPSVSEKLPLKQNPGLSEFLTGNTDIASAVQEYKSSDGKVSFQIIASGAIPENPAELLNGKRMKNLMTAIKNACDVVILDFPPVDAVIDAVSAGKNTDGMLIVVRENNCPVKLLQECVEQLQFAKINILGFVVNGSRAGTGKSYNYSYGYYK